MMSSTPVIYAKIQSAYYPVNGHIADLVKGYHQTVKRADNSCCKVGCIAGSGLIGLFYSAVSSCLCPPATAWCAWSSLGICCLGACMTSEPEEWNKQANELASLCKKAINAEKIRSLSADEVPLGAEIIPIIKLPRPIKCHYDDDPPVEGSLEDPVRLVGGR